MSATFVCVIFFIIAAVTYTYASPVHQEDPMINPGMFEGDVLRPPKSDDRNAIPLDSQRWPGGEIPYTVDKSFNSKQINAIKKGMEHISSKTCIQFVERTHQRDYIKIFEGKGCYAHWGRLGGEQSVSLGNGCINIGTIVHELLHAVGFEHEHNRSDRDNYLVINWENIQQGYDDAFETLMPHEERLLTDFDFDSVMLYGSYAFSKEMFDLKTMEAIDGREMPEVFYKKGMSLGDIERIKMLYEC